MSLVFRVRLLNQNNAQFKKKSKSLKTKKIKQSFKISNRIVRIRKLVTLHKVFIIYFSKLKKNKQIKIIRKLPGSIFFLLVISKAISSKN